MTSYWVTVQCRQTELLRENQLFTQPTFACDRFFPVHFRSDILSKPFFFHPLHGTIHPDSFVRDLISGQSIDRHSHSRNQVLSPCVEFCLLSSRPLRSLFTFGYTRTSSTRARRTWLGTMRPPEGVPDWRRPPLVYTCEGHFSWPPGSW